MSCFHDVINALLILYKSNVNLLSSIDELTTSSRITDSCKYTPYFNDCLGALNGTHIELHIPTELQPRY